MLLYVIVRSVLLYTLSVCNKGSTEGSGRQVDIGDKHITVISVSDFHSKPGLVLDALLRGSDCVTRPRVNFCINKKMKDWKVQQTFK
jgi:hypothetical protein